jgi:hypothetical protein
MSTYKTETEKGRAQDGRVLELCWEGQAGSGRLVYARCTWGDGYELVILDGDAQLVQRVLEQFTRVDRSVATKAVLAVFEKARETRERQESPSRG